MDNQKTENDRRVQRLINEVNRLKSENASLKKKAKRDYSLKSYPMHMDGREHLVYLAKDVDEIIQHKNDIIENLEARLRVRELVTFRTRSG